MPKIKHYALIDTSIADSYHEDTYEIVDIYSNDKYLYVIEKNKLYGEYEIPDMNSDDDSGVKIQFDLLGKVLHLSDNYDAIKKKLDKLVSIN